MITTELSGREPCGANSLDSLRAMRRTLPVAALIASLIVSCSSGEAHQRHRSKDGPLTVQLRGSAEGPDPGDPDGKGTATVSFARARHEICATVTVEKLDPVVAIHLQQGPTGQSGPIVLPLPDLKADASSRCRSVDEARFEQIRAHPEQYFINVRTVRYPGGAIRGQLENAPVTAPTSSVHIPGASAPPSTKAP